MVGVQQVLPVVQTWPVGHVPQLICWPQLFVTVPQVLLAHAVVLLGVQHVPAFRHMSLAPGQVQGTGWPQLFATWPHFPAQVVLVGSGVQPALQVFEAEQLCPCGQSATLKHWTQDPVLHRGLSAGQQLARQMSVRPRCAAGPHV